MPRAPRRCPRRDCDELVPCPDHTPAPWSGGRRKALPSNWSSIAAQVLADGGVSAAPASLEIDVKSVLARVTSGEADAGLVYVTDVQGAGNAVDGIAFPESDGVVNTYPIAVLRDSDHTALARQFVDFVLGSAGRRVLADAGFGTP